MAYFNEIETLLMDVKAINSVENRTFSIWEFLEGNRQHFNQAQESKKRINYMRFGLYSAIYRESRQF